MRNTLGIYKIYPDIENLKYATEGSACFDICAHLEPGREITYYSPDNRECSKPPHHGILEIYPGQRYLIPTGLIFDIPNGHSLRLHPRSGLSLKKGLILSNCEGVIDSDYVNELFIILTNVSRVAENIKHGDKICQCEIIKDEIYKFDYLKTSPKEKTNRSGGFGSTGN